MVGEETQIERPAPARPGAALMILDRVSAGTGRERLSEALESEGEALRATGVPGVRSTEARAVDAPMLAADLDRLRAAVLAHDDAAVAGALAALVPEYRPQLGEVAEHRDVGPTEESPTSVSRGPARLRIVKG